MMADMEIPNDYVIYVFWQPVYLESFNLFFRHPLLLTRLFLLESPVLPTKSIDIISGMEWNET